MIENLFKQINAGYYAIPPGMSNEDYAGWMMGEMSQHGKQVPYSSADGRHFVGSSHLTQFGGALMFVSSGYGFVKNNIFQANSTTGNGGALGLGDSLMDITIKENGFCGNVADGAYGGAVWIGTTFGRARRSASSAAAAGSGWRWAFAVDGIGKRPTVTAAHR